MGEVEDSNQNMVDNMNQVNEEMCIRDSNKTQKWDVTFNNGKTYSYANENVEKLTEPESLNPNMYRINKCQWKRLMLCKASISIKRFTESTGKK